MSTSTASSERLPTWVKVLYGSGDWGISTFNTLRLIFYAIFLVDVVGLDPRLASFATLFGIIWDAINDPLVGMISDRVQRGRFGKRRTFLVLGAIPFGLGFMLLWWAPPFENEYLLLATVTLAFMIADTFQSLVSVPYFSLTPEITHNYHERTALTSFRMFFNLTSSLVVAVAAPLIVDGAVAGGATQQQGYMTVSAIFGASAVLPLLLIGFFIREEGPAVASAHAQTLPFRDVLRTAWGNVPFRFATAIYMLNWMAFDLIALMLPFFLTYWVAGGDLLGKANLFGINLALESAVLGVLLITAVFTLPLWNELSRRVGKRRAYTTSLAFWTVVQVSILGIGQGQVNLTLFLAFLAGIGASAAHVLPDAIFPDVMEWDELRLGRRHEGIYYGVKNFSRKLTGAFATFIALQVLGWFGYQSPPEGATVFAQAPSALTAIRVLTSVFGGLMLIGAGIVTFYYPLTRARHDRIRRLLERRKARAGLAR